MLVFPGCKCSIEFALPTHSLYSVPKWPGTCGSCLISGLRTDFSTDGSTTWHRATRVTLPCNDRAGLATSTVGQTKIHSIPLEIYIKILKCWVVIIESYTNHSTLYRCLFPQQKWWRNETKHSVGNCYPTSFLYKSQRWDANSNFLAVPPILEIRRISALLSNQLNNSQTLHRTKT